MERVKPEIREEVMNHITELIGKAGDLTAFARSIDVKRDSVNNWLLGRSDIRLNDLVKISEKYGVSVDYLLGLAKSPTRESDKQKAEEYIGLSPESVENLHLVTRNQMYKKSLDSLLSDPGFFASVLIELNRFYSIDIVSDDECLDGLNKKDLDAIDKVYKTFPVILSPEQAANYFASRAGEKLTQLLNNQSPLLSDKVKKYLTDQHKEFMESLKNSEV